MGRKGFSEQKISSLWLIYGQLWGFSVWTPDLPYRGLPVSDIKGRKRLHLTLLFCCFWYLSLPPILIPLPCATLSADYGLKALHHEPIKFLFFNLRYWIFCLSNEKGKTVITMLNSKIYQKMIKYMHLNACIFICTDMHVHLCVYMCLCAHFK